MSVFIPTYFSPISQWGMMYQSEEVLFECEDNFQKQTYRNRCYIYGANGKQLLNIPIIHDKSTIKQKSKEVRIENSSSWKKQHLKSLKSAYNSSPFFEFFEHDLNHFFEKNYLFLLDLNMATFFFIKEALELDISFHKTTEYRSDYDHDFRRLAEPKPDNYCISNSYTQVFQDKHGYLHNLSILDLIFMEGPNSISFLEKVNVTLH